jgi:hypothetical protein
MTASLEVSHLSNSSVLGFSPESNDVSTEAEESLLLRSVTGKGLVAAE